MNAADRDEQIDFISDERLDELIELQGIELTERSDTDKALRELRERRIEAKLEGLGEDHIELLKKLPHVRSDLVDELQKLSRWALQRRILIQADWLGSYSRCLDDFNFGAISGAAPRSCWDPRYINAIVGQLVKLLRDCIHDDRKACNCDSCTKIRPYLRQEMKA